jgi:hypothetical protein
MLNQVQFATQPTSGKRMSSETCKSAYSTRVQLYGMHYM